MTVGQLPPSLVTLPEAARMLGISVDTAKRLVRDGEFPGDAARRVGRQVRVSVPRLEQWLHGDAESGRSVTGPPAINAGLDVPASGGTGRVDTGSKGSHRNDARPDVFADTGSRHSRRSA